MDSLGLKGDSAAVRRSFCNDQILSTDNQLKSAAAKHNCGEVLVLSCLRSLGASRIGIYRARMMLIRLHRSI